MAAVSGTAITVTFGLWDTANNAWKTGDEANITLSLIADGVASVPTAVADEVGTSGQYRCALTGGEHTGSAFCLRGTTTTADCVIVPACWTALDATIGSRAAATDLTAVGDLVAALVARIGAWAGTGANTLLGAIRAITRTDAPAVSDLGGTYGSATDSLEAISDGMPGTDALEAAGAAALEAYDAATAADVAAGSAGAGDDTVICTVADGLTVYGGIKVTITNADETAAPLVQYTSSAGEATFYLTSGQTYKAIAGATVAQGGGEETFVVAAGVNAVEIAVTGYSIPAPAPAGYCSVRCLDETPSGAAQTGTFELLRYVGPATRTDSNGETVTITIGDDSPELDAQGRAAINILQGATVTLRLTNGAGRKRDRVNVVVPAAASANWEDLVEG